VVQTLKLPDFQQDATKEFRCFFEMDEDLIEEEDPDEEHMIELAQTCSCG
jgi:hypothetical protein